MKEKNKVKNNMIARVSERREKFNLFIEKLIEYKEKHSGFAGVTRDKELGRAIIGIRQARKGKDTYKLTPEMIEKLDAIGFDWGKDKEEIEGQWFAPFYEKLIAYKNEHGSFACVVQDKEIGNTVDNIRSAYKGHGRTKLTPEMIDKLNEIGFPWKVEKTDWFTPFYEKLIEYKEKYGDFAGITKDKEIGSTVNAVRQAYKGNGRTKLTPEMIEKLNAIGFPLKKSWFTQFYEKLVAYKEKHGDFAGIVWDKEIGYTVIDIRCAYKGQNGTKLTKKMIEKLNEIGFPWEAKSKKAQEDNLSV